MFGVKTQEFVGLITLVNEHTVFAEVTDKDKEKSYMDIPIEDLKDSGVLCKAGVSFRFVLKGWRGWAKMTFYPIARKPIPPKEVDKILKDRMIQEYKDKYKDV